MRCAAVIVAAGQGARFGHPLHKILHRLGNRTLLDYSIDAFDAVGGVETIVVVVHRDDRERLDQLLRARATGKALRVVEGGARRLDSVLCGVRASGDVELVAIHDAARPLVKPETIAAAIAAASRAGGAVVALAAVDTVKRSGDGRVVDATIPRREVFLAQTPQVFRREPFLRALEDAARGAEELTDDAAVAERVGLAVEIVPGDPDNVKITYPSDLARAEAILAQRGGVAVARGFRVGTAFDVHRLEAGRRCVLGGVEIASDVGPVGHSDGDPLLHALADAVLGAAGLDDLGTLFPDDDERSRGADSSGMLRGCVELARAAGFVVVNADAVLVLERPRIGPHRAAIRARVAELLGVAPDRVNVKGKSAEGLGAIGEGRAVACHASVLLQCDAF